MPCGSLTMYHGEKHCLEHCLEAYCHQLKLSGCILLALADTAVEPHFLRVHLGLKIWQGCSLIGLLLPHLMVPHPCMTGREGGGGGGGGAVKKTFARMPNTSLWRLINPQ